jgi:hypothetical protein
MELKDFLGEHLFSGVDFNTENIKRQYGDDFEDCQCVNFIVDGKTYTAIEDPEDGYRSCMREVKESTAVVKNTFEPVRVLGMMKRDGDYHKNDVLELVSLKNGLVIFEVGTENTDDYYPCWIAKFSPENLSV